MYLKVFFGQKYGNKNLPSILKAETFEIIQNLLKQEQDKHRKSSKLVKKTFKTVISENTVIESIDESDEKIKDPPLIINNENKPDINELPLAKFQRRALKTLLSEKSFDSIDEMSEIEHSAKSKETRRVSIATPSDIVKEMHKATLNTADNTSDVSNEIRRISLGTPHVTENNDSHEGTIEKSASTRSTRTKLRRSIFDIDPSVVASMLAKETKQEEKKAEAQKAIRTQKPVPEITDLSVFKLWYELDKSFETPVYLLKPIR